MMRDLCVCLLLLLVRSPLAGAAEDTSPPSIIHEPCEQYQKGQAFEIRARLIDESAIFDPKVIYRSGNDFWKNVPLVRDTGNDEFKAVIKAKDLKGTLEYFIEAFDENGNGPARYGSPEAPIKVAAATEPVLCQQVNDLGQSPRVQASSRAPGANAGATPGAGPGAAAAISSPAGMGAPTGGSRPAVDLQTAPPPPPPATCDRSDRPFYCSPLFWGVTGAVVLGGGGVLGYMLLKKDDTLPSDVRLHVSAPAPTAAGLAVRLP